MYTVVAYGLWFQLLKLKAHCEDHNFTHLQYIFQYISFALHFVFTTFFSYLYLK